MRDLRWGYMDQHINNLGVVTLDLFQGLNFNEE